MSYLNPHTHDLDNRTLDSAALDALSVIALDPKIRAWLAEHDPMALAQVDAARVESGGLLLRVQDGGQAHVEKVISDYQGLIEALQAIARRVLQLRNEAGSAIGDRGPSHYVPRDNSDFRINLDGSRTVEVSYYFAHEDRFFDFPLAYAWQPDYEDRERQYIAARAAAVEADRQKKAAEVQQSAEAHERALYERLRAKYGTDQ